MFRIYWSGGWEQTSDPICRCAPKRNMGWLFSDQGFSQCRTMLDNVLVVKWAIIGEVYEGCYSRDKYVIHPDNFTDTWLIYPHCYKPSFKQLCVCVKFIWICCYIYINFGYTLQIIIKIRLK